MYGPKYAQVAFVIFPALLGHGHSHRQLGDVGQELVQRWVEEPHGDGQPVHGLQDAAEVFLLER